ncbi:MAG: QueT transporter family protein [Clostridia bacterium]|nr:QueT transporter family protein [Clostridia bacterium]
MTRKHSTAKLVRAALVAALYVALTVTPPLSALSFGAVQLRVSEALCILPFLFPETGAGLVLGCLISNFFSPNLLPLDIALGTLATLLAVTLTVRLRKYKETKWAKWIAALPTVLSNAVIVPFIICFSMPNEAFGLIYLTSFLSVGLGEVLGAWGLGTCLYFILKKLSKHTN